MNALWVIVPCKGLAAGKSRLSGVLDATARDSLNRQLLRHTLEVLADWRGGLDGCLVVSPCERALSVAAASGAHVLGDPAGIAGLNRAIAAGAGVATARGAGRFLILPCDLPALSPESLDDIVRHAARPGVVVIAPDRCGDGTNALLVDAGSGFRFQFGRASRARHVAEAARLGWRCAVHADPNLAFDLDTPEDLARCTGRFTTGSAIGVMI